MQLRGGAAEYDTSIHQAPLHVGNGHDRKIVAVFLYDVWIPRDQTRGDSS
jgi:hypothetical protein